jgi:hypothetical protein
MRQLLCWDEPTVCRTARTWWNWIEIAERSHGVGWPRRRTSFDVKDRCWKREPLDLTRASRNQVRLTCRA